jgi:hypothetical protein
MRSKSSREHADVARLISALDESMAVDLAFLRQLRNNADYDLHLADETITLQVLGAIGLANSIISRLDELLPPGTDS